MTVDEELSQLEESIRRLKVEYDVYFGGGAKKPPADTEWRVHQLLKKYQDGNRMNFAQRFRFNSLQQKFALYNSLWQQKLKIKEEGYRRPQDAALGIAGMRVDEEHAAAVALATRKLNDDTESFRTICSDVSGEQENVKRLFNAMMAAKNRAGEKGSTASFESFKAFVQKKTDQIRKEYGCHSVEYSVELENGQVRLKAKARV